MTRWLFGIYLFLYPGSVVTVALDAVPAWAVWMGGLLIVMQGAMLSLWLALNYGRAGVLAAVVIGTLSGYAEYLGETQGFLFGSYNYTNVLLPKIAGSIPLAIPFAWLLVIPAALWTAQSLRRDRPVELGDQWGLLVGTAILAVVLDIGIEPVATLVNGYWVWNTPGVYYGVPFSNFVGWFLLSLILAGLTIVLLHRRGTGIPRPQHVARLPYHLYLLNTAMFAIVNLAHQQIFAGIVGMLALGFVLLAHLERPLTHWVLTGQRPSGWALIRTHVL